MTTTATNHNENINIEREKGNLLSLIKLTLNTLIDQASSTSALPVLDDRNADVTNFIITLERVLCFRMRAGWLTERRYFWDFIRPACIGSCRQSIIERVEEISNTRSLKDKGRAWIKLALMEKKLSELLKLVISDCHLVQKFYHEDSIMTSSPAFILCDQLAGLNGINFSFCFKHDGPIIAPLLLNDAEIDIIDLTPFLCYKSKYMKQLLKDQRINDENKQPSSTVDDAPSNNPTECEMISLDRYKVEVEQRKYFEELLQHRDRELQQLKIRYETLKGERESEIVQMENIILELQLELRAAREESELRRKKTSQSGTTTPPKNGPHSDNRKASSPPTPTNNNTEKNDAHMRSTESSVPSPTAKTSKLSMENVDQNQLNDFVYPPPSQSSRRSSLSTTTTNTDEDQYEFVRKMPSETRDDTSQTNAESKLISSPEMLSSATSFSTPSSSDDDEKQEQTVTTNTPDEKKSITDDLTTKQVESVQEDNATA